MKNNIISKLFKLSIISMTIFSTTAHAKLNIYKNGNYNFCKISNLSSTQNLFLDFQSNESLIGDAGFDELKNILFVGTSFKVNRSINTFTQQKLLNSNDIAKLSGSEVENIKKITNGLTFQTNKPIPLGSLVCQNSVKTYSFDTFSSSREFSHFSRVLIDENCLEESKTPIVTIQRISSCNKYFDTSYIITFYSQKNNKESKILSFTFNSLKKKPNFFIKTGMEEEIKKSVDKIPSIITKF